jgi:predicted transcriptional regulator
LSKVYGADEKTIERTILNSIKDSKTKALNRKQLIDNVTQKFNFQERKISRVLNNMVSKNMLTQHEGTIKMRR